MADDWTDRKTLKDYLKKQLLLKTQATLNEFFHLIQTKLTIGNTPPPPTQNSKAPDMLLNKLSQYTIAKQSV